MDRQSSRGRRDEGRARSLTPSARRRDEPKEFLMRWTHGTPGESRHRRGGVAAPALAAVMAALIPLAAGGAGPALASTPVPGAPACPVFPSDNVWNADITS